MTVCRKSRSCHLSGCKNAVCVEANRVYIANRNRNIAYGRPTSQFVDVAAVREHVRNLQAQGMGYARIADHAAVPASLIGRILGYERKPAARVKRESAERILRVKLDLSASRYVPAVGTVRRLRALAVCGWSHRRLSAELGWSSSVVTPIIGGKHEWVRAWVAQRVVEVYDRLWDQAPPSSSKAERAAATLSRKVAAGHGWVPPAAWDDDSIDDPAAVPDVGEPGRSLGRIDVSEVEWLRSFGTSDELIAAQMGLSVKSLRNVPRKQVAA